MTALFPFDAPSTPRPPRRPQNPDANAFVLGVYPSALHVRPCPLGPPSGLGPTVAALAVDVEPTVFWDGQHPDAGELGGWNQGVWDCHQTPANRRAPGNRGFGQIMGADRGV